MNPIEFTEACRSWDGYRLWAETAQRIQTDFGDGKKGMLDSTQVRPFIPSKPQNVVIDGIEKTLYQQKPVREMWLKHRQGGSTTLGTGLLDWRTRLWTNQGAFILAHDKDASENIHDKIKIFYYNTPDFIPRPLYKNFNRDLIHYENPDPQGPRGLNCKIANSTADKNVGASFSLHFVLISELSRFESVGCNPYVLFQSLLPAVPYKHGTFVIKESTAEEGGDYFKTEFLKEESDYVRRFWGWIADETYFIPLTSGDYFPLSTVEDSMFGNEKKEAEAIRKEIRNWHPEIAADHNWFNHHVMERLAFRRMKIKDECGGDKEAFRRIYPTTAEDAFRAGTATIYNQIVLSSMESDAKKNYEAGGTERREFLQELYDPRNDDWCDAAFQPAEFYPNGYLEVHEAPRQGWEYAIGADPSQGLMKGDEAAAVVLRIPDAVEVATWNWPIPPDDFAYVLYALGIWYNGAILGVETNSVGTATHLKLLRDIFYPNLHQREQEDDKIIVDITEQYGWHTNSKTKHIMISHARRCVSLREVGLRSLQTITEHQKYKRLKSGQLGIENGTVRGKSANLVMATAIALQLVQRANERIVSKETKKSKTTASGILQRILERQKPNPFRKVNTPTRRIL